MIQKSSIQQNSLSKSFSHELLFSITQEYPQHSFAQAINTNNTLIVTGSSLVCKVMYLKNELKLLQQSKKHKGPISTLNFFKQKSQFISGSNDSSITIWPSNLLQNFKYITQLKGHTHWISCLVVKPNTEDLIISGSVDRTIRFWSYSSSSTWSCSQIISEHSDQVFGLSINQDGTKLVSCGRDNQILIMERSEEQLWYVKQKISEKGYRISFIKTDLFVFQPCGGAHLQFYTIDLSTGLYIKSKELQVQGAGQDCQYYFPQIYISSKQLLLSKNGYFVNLIQFNFDSENWDCKFEQGIEFNQRGNFGNIFGTMSDNGEYLITWDCMTGKIQIRQFTYKNYMNDKQIIN